MANNSNTTFSIDMFDPQEGRSLPKYVNTRDIFAGRAYAKHTLLLSNPKLPEEEQVAQSIATIKNTLRQKVQEGGTLAVVRFHSHGSPRTLYHGDTPVNIDHILNTIIELQTELGTPIAKQIELLGCNTFTNLSPKWVKYLRDASTMLNAEIIGTSGFYIGVPIAPQEALIRIRNGEVLGHMNVPSAPMLNEILKGVTVPLMHMKNGLVNGALYSHAWVDCHEGRTQEQGADCQRILGTDMSENDFVVQYKKWHTRAKDTWNATTSALGNLIPSSHAAENPAQPNPTQAKRH